MIDKINTFKAQMPENSPWIERLLRYQKLHHLDRNTVVEMISMIYICEDNTIKIVYNFSDELELFLNRKGDGKRL